MKNPHNRTLHPDAVINIDDATSIYTIVAHKLCAKENAQFKHNHFDILIETLNYVLNESTVSLEIVFGNKSQALGYMFLQHPHGSKLFSASMKSPSNQHSLRNAYFTILFITFQQHMQEHYSLECTFLSP